MDTHPHPEVTLRIPFKIVGVVLGWLALSVAAVLVLWFLFGPEDGSDKSMTAANHSFEDVALQAGIKFKMAFLPGEQGEKFKVNLYDHGTGVAIADYDGDGKEDIYFVNQLGRNALYKNLGNGTFVDVAAEAGVALGDRICVAAVFADYDNDGLQDLFVTSTRGGNVLFKNLGKGKFKEVTRAAGVAHIGHSQMGIFFDYDNDGYLDLLLINTAQWTEEFDPLARYFRGPKNIAFQKPADSHILYRNNGNGTFSDVTAKAGLKGRGWGGDVAVLDFDEDGFADVLITCMFGPAQLYRNTGKGGFVNVTATTLQPTPFGGMGAKAFDFNNDGKLDLFIVDMHSDMWMGLDYKGTTFTLVKDSEKKKYPSFFGPYTDLAEQLSMQELLAYSPKEVVFGNALYKNLGRGRFEEISDKANMETMWPWGIASADFDNDGYEDVFIPSGMGFPFYHWPNYLMMNNGDETFTDRALAVGLEPPPGGIYLPNKIRNTLATRSSRSAATADFDGSGKVDLVVNNFNDRPYLFKNRFPRKNYIAFELTGTASNRDAIGAVVRLYAGKHVMTRQVEPAGGFLAQSSRVLHFGLGDREVVDRVEIKWPRGRKELLKQPKINQRHRITEPN